MTIVSLKLEKSYSCDFLTPLVAISLARCPEVEVELGDLSACFSYPISQILVLWNEFCHHTEDSYLMVDQPHLVETDVCCLKYYGYHLLRGGRNEMYRTVEVHWTHVV